MEGAIQQWLECQADRVFARHRAKQDSAKLLATFTAGVAAAIVGTALQVAAGKISWVDYVGTSLLALSVLLALVVVLSDRLKEPDHEKCIIENAASGGTPQQLLGDLRRAVFDSLEVNEMNVKQTNSILTAQILVSAACVTAGLVSMLVVHRAG